MRNTTAELVAATDPTPGVPGDVPVVRTQTTPDDTWLKQDIIDWLDRHYGVTATQTQTKAELLQLVADCVN